jgi:ATP-dependent Clp protease ATP-binding subunit ClpA
MWQERCQRLCREASRARAVVYLGNLIELTEVGPSTHNAQGIANFLRPYIGRGEILSIAECTPEQLAVLEREDPHALEVFTQLQVDEPAPETSRAILLHELLTADPKGPSPMDDAALDTVDALHRRYATYSAFPARPVRFVRNMLRDRASAHPTATITRRDVLASFARETGLPLMLLDEYVPLDLDETRRGFAARVIGQGEAVDLVCDLIAMVKAAMARPRRPIACCCSSARPAPARPSWPGRSASTSSATATRRTAWSAST